MDVRRTAWAAAWAACVPVLVWAAPAFPGERQPPGYDANTGQRSYSQHAYTKIRPGSVLHANEPFPESPDLRSDLERRRDAELTKHFSRMAELDVIAELAEKSHKVSLEEKVEEVRRKESQRNHEVMQLLRQATWKKVLGRAP